MDTVENNNFEPSKIKEILFSKDTISTLNKKLLEKFNLTEINKDSKKKVIDLLIKNMKTVYRSLDHKKITQKNFNSIFTQYNKACLEQTSTELGRADILKIIQPDASQLKHKRDFESNPNAGNKIMDRPRGVSNKSQNQNHFLYPPELDRDNKNNNGFDNLFKPIVDNIDDNYKFNQYQHGRGGEDFTQRMDNFVKERSNESIIPKRPTTPDFLKPVQTSVKQEIPQIGRQKETKVSAAPGGGINAPMPIKRNGGKPNFNEPIPEEQKDTAFLSLNENDNDLYNISNIDKPMDIPEIEEDNRPFEQRLKSLESDRNNIIVQKEPKTKINFQNPNLIMDDDVIPDYQPKSIDEIRREKEMSQSRQEYDSRNRQHDSRSRQEDSRSRQEDSRSRQEDSRSRQEDFRSRQEDSRSRQEIDPRRRDTDNRRQEMMEPRMNDSERKQQFQNRRQDSEPRVKREDLRREEMSNQERYDPRIQDTEEEELRTREERRNIPSEVTQPVKHELKPVLKSEDKNNKKPQIDMKKVEAALKKLTKITENDELIDLKKENELLKKKMLENDKYDFIKKELTTDFQKLSEKEKNISQKEEEMKVLLKKYNYVYGVKHIQMDISPSTPINDYVYEFNQINNIIGIKLMSYSIPQPRYNIEENKNNIFKIIIDGEEKEYTLKSGKYKIEDVLSILGNKTGLIFNLNYEQKVEISLKKEKIVEENEINKTFDIIPTTLSIEILGMTSASTNNNTYTAEKTWDLRIEDKIYLFINNIEEKIPLAVLYLGNQAVQQFRFEEPINLNRLELHFKDSKGRPFNFYNLSYNLNIQLELNDTNHNELVL